MLESGDNTNKIYVGNLPLNFGDSDVKALLEVFGPLKDFSLVKDPDTNESKVRTSLVTHAV